MRRLGKRKMYQVKKKIYRKRKRLKLPKYYFNGESVSSEGEVSEWLPDEDEMEVEKEKE